MRVNSVFLTDSDTNYPRRFGYYEYNFQDNQINIAIPQPISYKILTELIKTEEQSASAAIS